MPQPSQVYVSAPLTNFSLQVLQEESAFIAGKVFPTVPVKIQGGQYFIHNAADYMRDLATVRAPGAESSGSDFRVSTAAYFCVPYAHHKMVTDPERANADSVLRLDQNAVRYVMRILLTRKELDWVANFFGAGIWDTDWTGVGAAPAANQFLQWNVAGSDPVTDIANLTEQMRALSGLRPNTLVIAPDVWPVLKNHSTVLDRTKYTSSKSISLEIIAELMELDNVYRADAVYNNSANPAAPNVVDIATSEGMLLCYVEPNVAIDSKTAGMSITWTGMPGTNKEGFAIQKFRMKERRADRVEGDLHVSMQTTATALGAFLANSLA